MTGSGRVLDNFETRRSAYLLGRLAVSRQLAMTRGELADFLWPDDFFDATRLRLRQELTRLRRALGDARDIVQADREWVRLATDQVVVDIRSFQELAKPNPRETDLQRKEERLQQLLVLAENPLLDGFEESWIASERDRVAQTKYSLLVELASLQAEIENLDYALELAQKAVAIFPEKKEARSLAVWLREKLGSVAWEHRAAKEETPEPAAIQHSAASDSPRSIPASMLDANPTFQIPAPSEPIYGRQALLDHVGKLLAFKGSSHRLITLKGPGGIGKTRLAAEIAFSAQRDLGLHGAWISLVDTDSPANIPAALVASLGIYLGANSDPMERVIALLRGLPMLLVLDNFEQLLPGGEELVKTLLQSCPNLRILATSRIPLKIGGETSIAVGPLPLPGDGDDLDQPSMKLFLEPLLDEQVVETPSSAELEVYRKIVQKLEGIPLALQLASGRLRTTSAQELLSLLDRRLDIVNPRSDAPARHRTLGAAIAASFRSLTPDLKRIMGRLSVFRGGWNRESAAFVCDLQDPLPALELLLDASLIRVDREDQGLRFRMLETIREFVRTEIGSEELEVASTRHADWIIGLGKLDQWRKLDSHALNDLNNIDPELDNLREAARFCLSKDLERAILIGVAYEKYWSSRSLIREGLEFYSSLFEQVDLSHPTVEITRASFAHCVLLYISQAYFAGGPGEAATQRTIKLCEAMGLKEELNGCYLHQSRVHFNAGEMDQSHALIQKAMDGFREIGDPVDLALALETGAMVYFYQRRLDDAVGSLETAQELLGGADIPFHQVQIALMLSFMYLDKGDSARAKLNAHTALGLADKFCFKHILPMIQESCGRIAQSEGDLDLADEWYAVSAHNWDLFGNAYQHGDLLNSRSRIRLQLGKPLEALELAREAAQIWTNGGWKKVAPAAVGTAARAHWQLGNHALSARLLGAYKAHQAVTKSTTATEIEFAKELERELEAELGSEELGAIFAAAPAIDVAMGEAFLVRKD